MDIKELKSITSELNLLYVEDNSCVSGVNKQLFEDIFYRVDLAEDGEKGLDLYKKFNYDLVISDINLPKKNGLDMIKEVLTINSEQSIIVVSAFSELEYYSKLQKLNIKYFLAKPVKYEKMLSTIYKSLTTTQIA